MAKTLRMPSSGSLYAAEASIPGTYKAIWLGFAAACPAAGSVMWYRGAAASSGSPFLPITGCMLTNIYGPFIIPGGVYASMVGGSAIYWIE